ncbi:glutathione S-transferase Mu 1-like [Lethenteron reissneri]|uniref:glutathione S-transferase Mu 1-like n=1 Tax=Lethenteron reissneri TaxID=7753 RepID=UPI002AB754D8|nr:glutathione S-transferase Mu 1-like [Lethenteron reissneri]
MPLVLGYWDIRGLAHAIRLLLEYVGEEWEDKLYVVGDAPGYDRKAWLEQKHKLGLDFPNLPYLLDGDVKLTQSNAILRHIARKHGLVGQTEKQQAMVDMLENEAMDIRMRLVYLCYGPDFAKNRPGFLESVPPKMQALSTFLGDKEWFTGDKLTYVDLVLYDVLDQHRLFDASLLLPHPNLGQFLQRVEALDKIAAFMKSSRFIKSPINNRMASWGNKKE